MKIWLFPTLISLFFLSPINASAQEAIALSSLEIDLWPEYDRPEMLVIYRIELSPEVSLPVDLSIQIPASVGGPNAVAVQDPNGSLFNAPYEREVNGDWAIITLTASSPDIQIEYYDPNLLKHGSERIFEFTWRGDYQIDSFFIKFQQPATARQVVSVPGASSVSPGSDGLTYHTIDFGSQPAGASSSVSISYIKENDALSLEGFQAQPSEPLSGNTPGRVTILGILPWILGMLGVILVIGGALWYWRTGYQKPQPRKRSARRGTRTKRPLQKDSRPRGTDQDGVYCHECGKRAETRDRFCRSCGTKLRTP